MRYRIRYSLWSLESSDPTSAKRQVVELLKAHPDTFITVEPDTGSSAKKPLWKLFLLG